MSDLWENYVLKYFAEVKFLAQQNSESLQEALQKMSLKYKEYIRH